MEFSEFPKIARLSRNCVITEKIDGTNASVYVPEDDGPLLFGSRTRWITPENDNYGFARWATDHLDELRTLGPGHHFGEWWGSGIQRKYSIGEKRFSLFNTARWIRSEAERIPQPELHENRQRVLPACCHVVPVLYTGPFDTSAIHCVLESLRETGSIASPGFPNPEGIIIYHEAARTMFKKTLEKDAAGKGQ